MKSTRSKDIKNAQKASVFLREIAQYFLRIALNDNRVQGLFVNRVKLSPDGGICTVLFYTSEGKPAFDEKLPILILYKPSVRSSLAKALQSRYTPNLVFAFDEQLDKQQKIDTLIDSLKEEGKL